MTRFDSSRAFANFQDYVMRRSRFMLDETSQRFVEAVLATSDPRRRAFREGRVIWRAQEGHGWHTVQQGNDEFEIPSPHKRSRMRPLTDRAFEGRVNPKGIPCLYAATDKETAMAEIRPSMGSYVSVGQFKTLRDLMILDCSVGHTSGINIFFEEPNDKEKEQAVWNDIDRAFSTPVRSDESSADYAATQYLSDLFKHEGYDGVVYKSNFGAGFNIALFDINTADLINCFLFQVNSVQFTFDEVANPYFVTKYYDSKTRADDSES